ncbi:MAG: hypothetical protein HY22_12305 [[Candidatus Thermochlorobacteriaceae] bacterium GBChlB]|nr:MAG: hypothetical protein HY22_12305 [[Candidatus Thermochlorobacteriaceae] bacterium GBChlB]
MRESHFDCLAVVLGAAITLFINAACFVKCSPDSCRTCLKEIIKKFGKDMVILGIDGNNYGI